MPNLVNAASRGQLVIFAGAGISMIPPTNLPSWRDVNRLVINSLADGAASLAGKDKTADAVRVLLARHEKERLPPEYQAQLLADVLGKHYFQVLQHLDSDRPNAAHLAIAAMARQGMVRAVLTTNFDRALEAAFTTSGVPLDRHFTPAHFESLSRDLDRFTRPGGACQLLKLHGSVDDPATLIDTLAQRKRGFPLPVMECVRHLLHWGHWVFLGFSGLDLEAEPNYLSLAQESDSAVGFTWLVRTGTEPRAPVIHLAKLYGERGETATGDLPGWLFEITDSASKNIRSSVEELARNVPVDSGNALDALNRGAKAWAEHLQPDACTIALARIVEAAAEPAIAAGLLQAVFASAGKALEPPEVELADLYARSVAANSLGCSLGRTGRHEEAVPYLKEAISIAEQIGDHDARDRSIRNLAWNVEALGETDTARQLYEMVLEGVRERNDTGQIAVALGDLSTHFVRQGEYDRAAELAQESLPCALKAGDEKQRILALNNLGIVAQRQERYEEALRYYEECEGVCRRLGDEMNLSSVIGSRGDTLVLVGRLDEAEALYAAVLELCERLNLPVNRAETFLSLGYVAQKRQDLEGAERSFERALEIFRLTKVPAKIAETVYRLMNIHLTRRNFFEAAKLGLEGAPLAAQCNPAFSGYLYTQTGSALYHLRRLDEAVQALREGQRIATERNDLYLRATAAQNLAATLLLQQRDEEAAAAYVEASDCWRKQNNSAEYARVQYGLAAVQLDQALAALSNAGHSFSDPGESRESARRMVELYPVLIRMYGDLGAPDLAAEFRCSAGSTWRFLAELEQAISCYREAARDFRAVGLTERSKKALWELEDLLHDKTNDMLRDKKLNDAIPWLIELADVATELGHTRLSATVRTNAAICMVHTTDRFTEARDLAQCAVDIFEAGSSDAQRASDTLKLCEDRLHAQPRTAGSARA